MAEKIVNCKTVSDAESLAQAIKEFSDQAGAPVHTRGDIEVSLLC